MEKFTIAIPLSLRQRRDNAMRKHGISPAILAINPGVRVERNRKLAAKQGVTKHRERYIQEY